jgi:hypothetical protein
MLTETIEKIKYYSEAILASIFLTLGIIGALILKYTPAINFLTHHPNFTIDLILLILLFLAFLAALLMD